MDEAERCDHVILLHEGEILAQGNPAQLAAPLRGHAFILENIPTAPRNLQSQIARLPGVVDTVIQGDGLRIVMQQPRPPVLQGDLAAYGTPTAVPPRLEDAFVSLLFNRTPRHALAQPPRRDPSKNDAAVVEVKDLSRYFGAFAAVKNVSFSVRKGEIFGLLGANGAGKSTTFRMLCGLLPSSSGTLRVAGVDLRTATAAARARIGYVSQKFSLYGSLSVQQNLSFFAAAYGLGNQRKKDRIGWALEDLELKDYTTDECRHFALGLQATPCPGLCADARAKHSLSG